MNLQLYLGYSYIGSIAIDPEAAIDPNYLVQKKQELEITHKDEIARSKSKLIFYVEASLPPKQKSYNRDRLWSPQF